MSTAEVHHPAILEAIAAAFRERAAHAKANAEDSVDSREACAWRFVEGYLEMWANDMTTCTAVVTTPRPPPAREAPRAILTRRGRCTWIVLVHQFPISYGECTVRGWTPAHALRRAERRGERLLAEYIARENPEIIEIHPTEGA